MTSSGRIWVISDCEGAENELLQTHVFGGATIDILVETHQLSGQCLAEVIAGRFEGTHDILRLRSQKRNLKAFSALSGLPSGLQAIALDELRAYPMEWLWMRQRG